MLLLLPECSTVKQSARGGGVSPYARAVGPGSRYWFADGAEYTFPSSNLAVNNATITSGQDKPNPYIKAAGVCGGQPRTLVFSGNPFGPGSNPNKENESGGGELP